jgi:hypothetical protein
MITITYMFMQDERNDETTMIIMLVFMHMNETFNYYFLICKFYMLVCTRFKQWLCIISVACGTLLMLCV